MTATVWVVHPVITIDVVPAARYGVIRYVTSGYVYGDQLDPSGAVPPAVEDALNAAADAFDPARDRLLIAGDHLQLVLLAAALGSRYDAFRVLRWDRLAGGYFDVAIGTRAPRDALAPGAAAC